jgi:hypothetical protein
MTRDELYNSILGLKNELLRCNLTYINRRSIGSIISADRMFEILIALDVYMQILDYYYDNTATKIEVITEDEILIIVQEATKLVKTFKSSYNGL